MTGSPYTIRNYQPADFDKYVRLRIEAEKLEPAVRLVPSQNLAEFMGRPDYSPEQDLFVAEKAGNIVGYIDLTPELIINAVILECWIYPEHRRKGLATRLLDPATRRAKVIGYCWTEIIDDREVNTSKRKGIINMIGTDPDYRGQGTGKRVLLADLAHLKNKDIQVTELTVDSENKEACGMRRS